MVKLAIGSVQFGLNYGITNKQGITPLEEVKKILNIALDNDINLIDTASSYQKSELVIAESNLSDQFKIVTKIKNLKNSNSNDISKIIIDDFRNSLNNLRIKKIYGLLLHNAKNLSELNGEKIWNTLKELKNSGLVNKIGVSVYDSNEIDFVINNFEIDLIQLPLNIYDQHLIDCGYISKLKKLNIEIHARSIFLQGLLLESLELLNNFFSPIKNHHQLFCDFLKNNKMTPLEGCLNFIKNTEVDYAVIGVNNSNQLLEIIDSFNKNLNHIDFKKFTLNNKLYTNPSNWKI